MIFVNSMSDLFHPDVPDAFIEQVAETMRLARWHTYQVLTKRPERHERIAYGRDCGTRPLRSTYGGGYRSKTGSMASPGLRNSQATPRWFDSYRRAAPRGRRDLAS